MADSDVLDRLGGLPLYAELADAERAELANGIRLLRFDAGETLMRQGAQPDGIYFVLSGRVQVTARLPGGGDTLVAEREPGSILGELALIEGTVRTATVTALEPVEAICADWRFLTAALAQRRPAAFKVFRGLALLLAGRLRLLHERIRDIADHEDRAYETWTMPTLAASPGGLPDGFDAAAFMPALPCFRDFDPASLAALRGRARIVAPGRGHRLVGIDEPAEHAYLVIRGAVASGFMRDGQRMHMVNVRGPGRFCAAGAVVEQAPASAAYVVCEEAVLLEFRREPFLALIGGDDELVRLLLSALIRHHAAMIARATNHLKRLVGLSRLFRQLGGAIPSPAGERRGGPAPLGG